MMSIETLQKRIVDLEKGVTELTRKMNLLWDKGGFSRWEARWTGGTGDVKLQHEKLTDKGSKAIVPMRPGQKSDVKQHSPRDEFAQAEHATWQASPPYEYKPLDVERAEIRVLIFDYASTKLQLTGPIRCNLQTCSLNERREVMNLLPISYTWGAPIFSEKISIDGKPFKVTKNLYDAIDRFRTAETASQFARMAPSVKPKWWIDAICINQEDPDERTSQVALMTRLYRSARLVHVWLGNATTNSDRAMELIRNLADARDSPLWTKDPGKRHQYQGPGTLPVILPDDPSQLDDSEKVKNYQAILELFNRDWWSRVWVRQEVALPPDVRFHCGNQQCSWKKMMDAASILSYFVDHYHLSALQTPELRGNSSMMSCFQRAEGLLHLRDTI